MTTDKQTKVIERHYDKHTPDELKIDDNIKNNDRVYLPTFAKDRMTALLDGVDRDMATQKQYMYGELVFIMVWVVSIFLPFAGSFIGVFTGFAGWAYLTYLGRNLQQHVNKRFGMMDGILFMSLEIHRDIQRELAEKKEQKDTNKTDKKADTITA